MLSAWTSAWTEWALKYLLVITILLIPISHFIWYCFGEPRKCIDQVLPFSGKVPCGQHNISALEEVFGIQILRNYCHWRYTEHHSITVCGISWKGIHFWVKPGSNKCIFRHAELPLTWRLQRSSVGQGQDSSLRTEEAHPAGTTALPMHAILGARRKAAWASVQGGSHPGFISKDR